jgi:hypothetical protein
MGLINSWKWVPESCALPRLDPAQFLGLMRNRNIGFVGDSLNENFLVSFLCVLRVPGSGRGKGLGKELIFPSSMSRWRITGPFCSPNTSKIFLVILENVCGVFFVYLVMWCVFTLCSACNFGVMWWLL